MISYVPKITEYLKEAKITTHFNERVYQRLKNFLILDLSVIPDLEEYDVSEIFRKVILRLKERVNEIVKTVPNEIIIDKLDGNDHYFVGSLFIETKEGKHPIKMYVHKNVPDKGPIPEPPPPGEKPENPEEYYSGNGIYLAMNYDPFVGEMTYTTVLFKKPRSKRDEIVVKIEKENKVSQLERGRKEIVLSPGVMIKTKVDGEYAPVEDFKQDGDSLILLGGGKMRRLSKDKKVGFKAGGEEYFGGIYEIGFYKKHAAEYETGRKPKPFVRIEYEKVQK